MVTTAVFWRASRRGACFIVVHRKHLLYCTKLNVSIGESQAVFNEMWRCIFLTCQNFVLRWTGCYNLWLSSIWNSVLELLQKHMEIRSKLLLNKFTTTVAASSWEKCYGCNFWRKLTNQLDQPHKSMKDFSETIIDSTFTFSRAERWANSPQTVKFFRGILRHISQRLCTGYRGRLHKQFWLFGIEQRAENTDWWTHFGDKTHKLNHWINLTAF